MVQKGKDDVSKATSVRTFMVIILLQLSYIVFLTATKMSMVLSSNQDERELDSPSSQNAVFTKGGAAAANAAKNHPMLSLEPSSVSLHPVHKLWTEMDPSEQELALDKVGVYLKKYGALIGNRTVVKNTVKTHGTCEMVSFASGHALCGPAPPDCTFFSFGINDDPSFDKKLGEDWNCRGFAGDPTVPHPSKLHPRVTFHNIGASMISDNEERLINKGGAEDWWSTSMTKLRFFLGLDHVNIIKMDCEGCEFALARDILREDPTFLYKVDQLSIETHVTKTWMKTKEDLYYFGLHFLLLEEAGFKLEWSDIFGCAKRHEDEGCIPELEGKYGYPCGYLPWPGHPKVVIGRSCQDFLWKRY